MDPFHFGHFLVYFVDFALELVLDLFHWYLLLSSLVILFNGFLNFVMRDWRGSRIGLLIRLHFRCNVFLSYFLNVARLWLGLFLGVGGRICLAHDDCVFANINIFMKFFPEIDATGFWAERAEFAGVVRKRVLLLRHFSGHLPVVPLVEILLHEREVGDVISQYYSSDGPSSYLFCLDLISFIQISIFFEHFESGNAIEVQIFTVQDSKLRP